MSEPSRSSHAAIENERRRLTNVAYRLLGSLADAEDVVQETYARWYALSPRRQAEIDAPGAWMSKVASRICLDQLGSARARRERYVGEWIPEPLPDRAEWLGGRPDASVADPADRVTLDESVTMAFLVVLESMTPAERVAFVLHEVFRYPFAEVAEIVGRTPAACRQLASSARRRLQAAGSAPAPPADRRARVVRAFKDAWAAQDIDAIIAVLTPDATATGDGGGLVSAAPRPLRGSREVAEFFAALSVASPSIALLERTVNGQPGLVVQHDGRTVSVMAFALTSDRINRIWAVLNPDKLLPWTSPGASR